MPRPEFSISLGKDINAEGTTKGSALKSRELPPDHSAWFDVHLDQYEVKEGALAMRGWALCFEKDYAPASIAIGFANEDQAFTFTATVEARPDVVQAYAPRSGTQDYGFYATIDLSVLPVGSYSLLLIVTNERDLKFGKAKKPSLSQRVRLQRQLSVLMEKSPFLSKAIRWVAGSRVAKKAYCESLDSLEELDKKMEKMLELFHRNPEAWFGFAQTFCYKDDTGDLQLDPLSAEYRDAQMALYHKLAGKNDYVAKESEPIRLDVEAQLDPHPFPFDSRNPGHIGNHLFNLAGIFKSLDKEPPARVLEYGMGSGFTSLHLAAAGFEVIGVDINADCVEIARRMAKGRGLNNLRAEVGEFGYIPEGAGEIEAVLFYESFHHCWDFDQVLAKLHEVTAPGCTLIFGNEPIYEDFPKPWGLRTDGQSLFEIRTKGWLELGFRTDFFKEVLDRTGWRVEALFKRELMSPVFRAKKKGR